MSRQRSDTGRRPRQEGRGERREYRGPRPFKTVYEDEQLIVVNKQPGVLAVPIPGTSVPNVKQMLDLYLKSQKRLAHIVHRIDRYTSGLMVFAKSEVPRQHLIAQFRAHTPERVYLALVRGVLSDDEGVLQHQLELSQDGFRQRVVEQGGTEARCHYQVRERLDGATLLEVRLDTGLKNQIRVQLQAAGHPLVGDRHYQTSEQDDPLGRQALHAWQLAFVHPRDEQVMAFEAPLPDDMAHAIARLRPRRRPAHRPHR